MRVLVVDDNATNRVLLVRQLEQLGCRAEAVASADAAVSRFLAEDFGLVLMDCQMPDRDGLEATREIRRQEAGRRRTPIIAVSGVATPEDRRLCRDAGMDDFLAKPVTMEGLAHVIDRWDLPFDETALASFGRIAADSPETLARLLENFLDDARVRLDECRSARENGDHKACAAAAHSVKGASAALGARGLRELARRIEAGANAEDPDGALARLIDQALAEVVRLAAGRPKK